MLTQCRVHSTIPAAGMDRARRWYADRLGFEPVRELPGGLMYDDAADGTRFIIFPSPDAGKSPNTIMGFATADLDTEVSESRSTTTRLSRQSTRSRSQDGGGSAWNSATIRPSCSPISTWVSRIPTVPSGST